MQILLANAKIMYSETKAKPWSEPRFRNIAEQLAAEMARRDVDTLMSDLGCSRQLAFDNWQRYQAFPVSATMPALLAYNGQAYKHLRAATLSEQALTYAQEHLWITCFLYGMLRPMDAIVPYRMEHSVALDATGRRPLSLYWRDILTDMLIASVKDDDGVLIHLSTGEYEQLFDWKRVCREVTVVQPLFYVRKYDGTLKMQAVWAKACRGAMVRFILENQISSPGDLAAFSHEGFDYCPTLGDELHPFFTRQ